MTINENIVLSAQNKASQAFKQLETDAKKATQTISQGMQQVEQGGKKAGAGLANFAQAGNLAVTAVKGLMASGLLLKGAQAMIQFGRASITAASNARELANQFNTVFADSAGEVRTELSLMADEMNRSELSLQGFAAAFQDTFVPLGFARDEAADMSVELVRLTEDLSSFKNISEDITAESLMSALVGNHETVRKFGVVLNETVLQEKLAAMGMQDLTGKALEQAKVLARLQIIQESTTDAQGDATDTSGELANQFRGLAGATEEAQVAIGEYFIPTLQAGIPVITQWVNALGAAVSAENQLIAASKIGAITQFEADAMTNKMTWTTYSAADALDWLTTRQAISSGSIIKSVGSYEDYVKVLDDTAAAVGLTVDQQGRLVAEMGYGMPIVIDANYRMSRAQYDVALSGVYLQASYDANKGAVDELGEETGQAVVITEEMLAAQKALALSLMDSANRADLLRTKYTDMGRQVQEANRNLPSEIGGFLQDIKWAQAGGGIAQGVFEQLKAAIESTNDPGKVAELQALIAPVLSAALNAAVESGQMTAKDAKVDLASMLGLDQAAAGDLLAFWDPEDLQAIQTQIAQIMDPALFGMDSLENLQSATNQMVGMFDGVQGGLQGIADTAPGVNTVIDELGPISEETAQEMEPFQQSVEDTAREMRTGKRNADELKKAIGNLPTYTKIVVETDYITNYITNYETNGSPGGGGGGGGSSPSCFAAGTPVRMANGEEWPIEDIQEGDEVLAFDPDYGTFGAGRVTRLFRGRADNCYYVTCENGITLVVTGSHPFYYPGRHYGGLLNFTAAETLQPGDMLTTAEQGGRLGGVKIVRIERVEGETAIYNLQIEPSHTYITGGVIGHNMAQKAAEGLWNYTVPAGHPNDTFPIWFHSGEKVWAIPRGERVPAAPMSETPAGLGGGAARMGGGSGGEVGIVNYNVISDFATADYYARLQARQAAYARMNSHMGG